jgi:S-DNA-T family DNA segregation ATPase FtsK/SpoIIIE
MTMETIQDFNSILQSFRIKASCVNHQQVDNYFFYDLKLNPAAKVKDVTKFSDEISLALQAPGKPSVRVMHDKGVVRLEFVSPRTTPLKLFDLIPNEPAPEGDIMCLLGQFVDGSKMWMDIGKNPHMLVAGTTGSGKSTLIHTIIANLLHYNDVELYLIDPKRIELGEYEGKIRETTYMSTYDSAMECIAMALKTMEFRYDLMRAGHSPLSFKPMVIIIDEFADLIMQDKGDAFYLALCKLAQKCRAARLHLILSTQRPSVNIINGTIKANFPARISCRVASHIDSKVILDASGAENLLGKGDALVKDNFRTLERFQVAYTSAPEVCKQLGM